jgi:hypothetical protein
MTVRQKEFRASVSGEALALNTVLISAFLTSQPAWDERQGPQDSGELSPNRRSPPPPHGTLQA